MRTLTLAIKEHRLLSLETAATSWLLVRSCCRSLVRSPCAGERASPACPLYCPYLDSPVRHAALVQSPQRRRHLACRTQQRALRHVQRPAAVGVEGTLYGARQRLEVALYVGLR